MNRLEGSHGWETQMEQVKVCIKIGVQCMESDRKKRPVARHIIDRLDDTANTVEAGINSSSVDDQVGFLKEQYCEEKIADLSSEYMGKGIRESSETEELAEHVGTLREEHWQQEQEDAPVDLWSSCWEQQYTEQQGASISSSNSGVFHKLKNLDIFGRKAPRDLYSRKGGPRLDFPNLRKFKQGELEPILKYENLIIKDVFGEVYRGLVCNVPITVRKLISETECLDEIVIQSQVIHKNIVRLRGCCLEFDNHMLVYDFLSTDSLHDILHINVEVPLNLGVRLSIAAASAGALAYAHSKASIKLLHGDLKPANILFNGNFVPKIFGFGLSRMAGSQIIPDISYMDPVYLETGRLTKKSDVYSFGLIILELLTRKKATNPDNNSLVRNFLENHKHGRKSTEFFDKEIAVTGDLALLDNLADIAGECLILDVDLRPGMKEVERRIVLIQSRKL
ncbi:hypothetical protein CFC21_091102 [Triticum aestivum]|uniref:Protein kinase domain-containing protein n=2 Tax=Triticum aestivum TaxID=4565 RepID=A0A3B6QBD9_WHEAT|nr:wall-associated receptor kinase 4-like [Triticum aestivum]XP_044417923.1 wall-associated receptor kinase 4-like [Triticum aestivum]XP_044417924.1 wall-associated receptor kinase 4-like [Triticum aestivum]XP_044417925.1 wall-associated receptor kinase 4-like [Triticum aestivum]KAF7087946.1 hypothetical protein CFC21_091102 [Triticum aestivum]